MSDILVQYFRDVKKLLPCSPKEKQRCIDELEADVTAFLEHHPDASLAKIYDSVGSPEVIAESFMSRISPQELSHKVSTKRRIAIGVIVIVTLLAVVIGAVAIRIANDVHDIHKGYFVEFTDDSTTVEPPVTSETKVY